MVFKNFDGPVFFLVGEMFDHICYCGCIALQLKTMLDHRLVGFERTVINDLYQPH